ncbi:hypothetical protein LX36DRAFT_698283 [Colletotrichum falcatum]|nr:hypothetical protein LX36DRAFT_698283 [Colletotrichum falcatum]
MEIAAQMDKERAIVKEHWFYLVENTHLKQRLSQKYELPAVYCSATLPCLRLLITALTPTTPAPTAGSSCGSVVAVRTNQVAIALGTETYGAIGSLNERSEAIGHNPTKQYSAEIAGKEALRGMKLGLPWNPFWSTGAHINSGNNREDYEKRIQELKDAGAEIYNMTHNAALSQIVNPYGAGHPSDLAPEFNHAIAFNTLLAVGYGEWLENWTFPEGDERQGMRSLAQMTEWNNAHNAITGALGNNTWWWDPKTGQSFYDAGVATNGTLGYPIAAVPTGADGYATPYGLCIYGKQWGEAKLVRVASALEDLFQWHETPQYFNYVTAEGPWDAPYPGYTCSESSLNVGRCEL